jgi:hypothetical protein
MKTTSVCQTVTQKRSLSNNIVVLATIALVGALTACGGNINPVTNPTSAAKTAVQVSMGDAPSDSMLAFSMDISSMSLTGSNGAVSVVASITPIELIHLTATMQPLAMVSAPQGSYTGASISIASATVMYMDPTTKAPMQKTIAGPITATTTFSTPMTVGAMPMALGFDMNMATSVTQDSNGNMTLNPVFSVTTEAQGSGNPLDPTFGGIQEMMGTVSSNSGSSFTMGSLQSTQGFTFATNSSTQFDNINSMSMMTNGMLVTVDGNLQADGSLMATHVQSIMNSGGIMGGGVVTAVVGQPATQLSIVMRNGAGTGMVLSSLAAGVTVNLNGSTVYQIDKDNVDMSSLPFTPVFDAGHIYAGQGVMPISSAGMMNGGAGGGMMGGASIAGTITASSINLQQQGLSGTVATALTSGSRASFTMALPPDSAFRTMTGATTVIVYQQSGTTILGGASIASGATVHTLGLLFLDAGQWKMVASRMGPS